MKILFSILIAGICTCLTLHSNLGSISEKLDKQYIMNLSEGEHQFTPLFYSHVKEKGSDHVLFSPLSLRLGLSMAAEFALGETKNEILEIGRIFTDDQERQHWAEKLNDWLNCENLVLANGAWLSSDYQFPPSFTHLLAQSYKSALYEGNFRSFSEEIREEINGWVKEKTFDQIENLIPEGAVNSQTKLVLINTLSMKAPWQSAFNPEQTYEAPFYGKKTTIDGIPYMHQIETFGFLDEEKNCVVELPFERIRTNLPSLSLFIVLPKEGYSLEEIEETLSSDSFHAWVQKVQPQKIDLSLPKFKIHSHLDAKEVLKQLGMQLPFSEDAEFDVGGQNRLSITDIVHNAVFEIDEWGGTGSAGTGLSIGLTSFPSLNKVTVDRPFLFFVIDRISETVLFTGSISDLKP